MARFLAPVLVVMVLGLAGTIYLLNGQADSSPSSCRGDLTIETAAGACHVFQVELAVSLEEKAQGLMFRTELAADAGMLFLYQPPQSASFWMRNTPLPLDIIFIAPDGSILKIAERTVPYSTTSIPSGGPVQAVLEVNGGTADHLGLAVGDLVRHAQLSAN